MENIYNGSDTVVDVADFLKNYQQLLQIPADASDVDDEDIVSAIILSWVTADKQIEKSLHTYFCFQDIDLLAHRDDVRVEPVDLSKANIRTRRDTFAISVPKSAKRLKCIEERLQSWALKKQPANECKYKHSKYILPKSQTEEASESESDELLEPYSDVLITVRVMAPMKYDPINSKRKMLKMDREIVVLGQQYLHELRDMIICSCDTLGPFVDISKDPSKDIRATDRYAGKTNSGFLFIGDTFYNDMRNEENLEYSKEIINWAKNQSEIQELKVARMEETRFVDLKRVRLGFPYVYQHFGACEHVLIFSDMRIITPGDNRIRSDYPYLQLLNNFRNIICDICARYEASHSVAGSSQHIFDPVLLCAKCLSSYHYVDGKKLGEFTAYRFRK